MGVSFLVFLLVARHVVSYFLYYSFFPLLSTLPAIGEKDIMYVPCFCSTILYLFAKKKKQRKKNLPFSSVEVARIASIEPGFAKKWVQL